MCLATRAIEIMREFKYQEVDELKREKHQYFLTVPLYRTLMTVSPSRPINYDWEANDRAIAFLNLLCIFDQSLGVKTSIMSWGISRSAASS